MTEPRTLINSPFNVTTGNPMRDDIIPHRPAQMIDFIGISLSEFYRKSILFDFCIVSNDRFPIDVNEEEDDTHSHAECGPSPRHMDTQQNPEADGQ